MVAGVVLHQSLWAWAGLQAPCAELLLPFVSVVIRSAGSRSSTAHRVGLPVFLGTVAATSVDASALPGAAHVPPYQTKHHGCCNGRCFGTGQVAGMCCLHTKHRSQHCYDKACMLLHHGAEGAGKRLSHMTGQPAADVDAAGGTAGDSRRQCRRQQLRVCRP